MKQDRIIAAYEAAKERYADLGIDTEKALKALKDISLSIHCWQTDDVIGFENPDGQLSGGIQTTGNYPGRARTPQELMDDLDQVLALGGDRLTAATTRQVLGLAGQELFQELFDAVLARDCAALTGLCRSLLHRGVDVGFFVRELSQHLRDLFLLRQSGSAIAASLNLPADEAALWQGLAPRFSPGHLHAAWQMTLEAQRGIVQNPDPATALELLLLNMALLPQLLPLENLVPGAQPAPQQQQPPLSFSISRMV